MDSRKQIKTKVSKYGLVAFRDNLSCQIFNIADINGPRRKVTGASVKIDIDGDTKRGTIISVADQKKCLQIEKEKLNVRKFFGLPNRKKAVARTVNPVAVSTTHHHVTRSRTKRKLDTLEDKDSANTQSYKTTKTIDQQQNRSIEKTENSSIIKQESGENSFFDIPVCTPVPDCLSPLPSVKPLHLTSKPPATLVPILNGKSSPKSVDILSSTINTSTYDEVPKLANEVQQISIQVNVPSTKPLKSKIEECCSFDPPVTTPIVNPEFISPIAFVRQFSPIRPALPSPIYASSPLNTDFVDVAMTSFSSPLDGHRSFSFFSPPIVDLSTPNYLSLETTKITSGPLERPLLPNSPAFIDPPTPDGFVNSYSSFDLSSSSMSGFDPLLISPPNDLPMSDNTTHKFKANTQPQPFQHTKIFMNHETSSMSGIEPLIQSFSEYPTPDHGFVDPERDPITNLPLISGPMKKRLDSARFPNNAKARRSLQFTPTDPRLVENNISYNNPTQIPLELTECSNKKNQRVSSEEDLPILDWLSNAPPPIQWMHEELLESEEQRNECTVKHEISSSLKLDTLSSRINTELTSPGWRYSSPNEDEVKLFANEDSDVRSVGTLSPIVTASTNMSHFPPDQMNPSTINVNTNFLPAYTGNAIYPAQQVQNGIHPMYTPILTVPQTSDYVPFTETSVKLLPIRQLAHPPGFDIQRPFHRSASEFPRLQSSTSYQQPCTYPQLPQIQLATPIPQVQSFTALMPSAQAFTPPQTYTTVPSVYHHFPNRMNFHTPPIVYDTPPTPVQILPRTLAYQGTQLLTTPNQKPNGNSKKLNFAKETIASRINVIQESQRSFVSPSSSTETPTISKVPVNDSSENQHSSFSCTLTRSTSHAKGQYNVQESYHKGQQTSSIRSITQSSSDTQEQHKEFASSSSSFNQDSHRNNQAGISRPDPCATPLPQTDAYIKTTVTVIKKSAQDLKAVRQLKYFNIDDPKLLHLKAAHVAKRYITSQYVQHVLDNLPDGTNEEPISYPYIIDTQVLRAALSTSTASPQHFARFLFDEIFTVSEFRDHSIRGAGGRRVLNQIKMASIKVAVSTTFPMENNEWQRCETSINNHIKSLERKMKRLTWLKFENYQS